MELSNIAGNLKIQNDLVDFYCDINTNMCRICLEKIESNSDMLNIFESKIPMHLSNMIMLCASVQIMDGDGLPNMICSKCMINLNTAWQFKMQCEHSDNKLKHFYHSNTQLPVNSDIDDFSVLIRHESPKKNMENIHIEVDTYNNDLSEDNVCSLEVRSDNDGEIMVKKLILPKSEKQDDTKVHQCDTCGKTFNRREYLTQHIRIHTGEKPYCCHLCNKRFVNSGHLTTHMRTHTGERPHICSLCPKAFSTKQELHKHLMVHNGDRPFVCKMCGKKFGSSSNLYSHEKHHTGEKNFTCEHCGKAFFTKHELKQHLVIHTGEKAYLCEFCNKRFSQLAHLKRHSKLHKNPIQ